MDRITAQAREREGGMRMYMRMYMCMYMCMYMRMRH